MEQKIKSIYTYMNSQQNRDRKNRFCVFPKNFPMVNYDKAVFGIPYAMLMLI
jgi:hypothetical protein